MTEDEDRAARRARTEADIEALTTRLLIAGRIPTRRMVNRVTAGVAEIFPYKPRGSAAKETALRIAKVLVKAHYEAHPAHFNWASELIHDFYASHTPGRTP